MARERRIGAWLSWRVLRAAPRQSMLLASGIAVAVAIGAVVSTVSVTAERSPEQVAEEIFGAADLRVRAEPQGAHAAPDVDDAALGQLLPEGSRIVRDRDAYRLLLSSQAASAQLDGLITDAGDPLQERVREVTVGAFTEDPASMAVTEALASDLGIALGDQVEVDAVTQPFTVSAVYRVPRDLEVRQLVLPLVAEPALLEAGVDLGEARWAVGLPASVDEQALDEELRAAGFSPQWRSELLKSVTSGASQGPGLAIGAALLVEVGLFTAAAFAITFRSARRRLGLLTTIGAPRRVVRTHLLAWCVLLGLAGGLTGVAGGLGVAALLAPVLAAEAQASWGAFTPAWAAAGELLAGAVVAAVLAGLLPIRSILRQDPMTLLRGGSPPALPHVQRRWVTVAAFAVAGCAGVILATALVSGGTLIGLPAAIIGVIATLWLIVTAAARRPAGGPPEARIALRSLLAAPGRAVIALTGICFLLTIVVAVLLPFNSAVHGSEATHWAQAPHGAALVATAVPLTDDEIALVVTDLDSPGAVAYGYVASAEDPLAPLVEVRTAYVTCSDGTIMGESASEACQAEAIRQGRTFDQTWVGVAEPDHLAAMLAEPLDEAERRAYLDGAAVLTSPEVTADATVDLVTLELEEGYTTKYPVLARVPALELGLGPAAGDHGAVPGAFIAPATAADLGLVPATGQVVGASDASEITLVLPPEGEVLAPGAVIDALPAQVANPTVLIEDGPQFLNQLPRILAAITALTVATATGAVAVTVALWSGSIRNDHQMLAAIGSPRRWRRRIGALMGIATALVSLVVATVWGVGAGLAFLVQTGTPLTVPWASYLALVVLLTAAAAATGALLVPGGQRPLRHGA